MIVALLTASGAARDAGVDPSSADPELRRFIRWSSGSKATSRAGSERELTHLRYLIRGY